MSHDRVGSVVSPVGIEEAAEIGALLARAFQHDPIKTAIYPDHIRRGQVLPLIFAGVVRAVAACGGHMTTTSSRAAAALWIPPGARLSTFSMLRAHGRDLARITRSTPIASIPTLVSVDVRRAARRKALMPGPHWYLMVLGVDPPQQGRGLGSLLVREGLDRADVAGVPAYLETESERNVAFYERLGFRVLETLAFDRHGIRLWLMARYPAG